MKSYNENDTRLKQDKIEQKDKENSSAGMIAGLIIIIIAIVGLFLYYKYELVPTSVASGVTTIPATTHSMPTANENSNVPANNQSVPATTNNY